MKLATAPTVRAAARAVLASSIASLLLAGMAHGVTWSGTQLLTLGVDPGDDDADLLASTVVTLDGAAGTLLKSVIFNANPGMTTTLTVNNAVGATRVLAANTTALGAGDGKSLVVAGSADFRIGAVADGGFANLELVKNGGTGELILDNLANDLDGATLRVVDGTMSIFGGGGTTSAVDTLIQAIRIDGVAAKLRFGSLSGTGTTFNNNVAVNESGTLEHTATSNDTLGGIVALAAGKTLTTNVTGGSLRLAGSLARGGSSNLTKTGAGTLYLSSFGSGTGLTTVSAGTLQYSLPGALYAGATANWTAANISVASGATLAVNVGGAGEFTTANVTALLTALSTVSNNGLKAGASFGFDTTNATGTVTYLNALVNSTGAGGGAVGFTKLGAGTLILSGTNTYTGPTTVSGGTLQLTKPAALYNGATENWTAANISVASGATLAVNVGGTTDFNADNVSTLLTQISTVANNGLKAGATVGFDAVGTVSYASPITNSTGAGGGAVGVAKFGAGTLSLNGVSTYSGATTVSAGTLALGAFGSINNSSGISIAAGATYDVSAVPGYTLAQSLSAKTAGTANVIGALHAGAQAISLQDGANIGTLALGSTLTLSGATLRFDLSATTSDRITVGGTVSMSGTNIIDVARLTSTTGLATGAQAYTLITAAGGLASGGFSLSNAFITIGSTNYTLSLSGDATHQYLGVTSGSVLLPTTYTLATSASVENIRVGSGTSTITTTITNTGTIAANSDALSYTSLGSTASPGAGVTLGPPATGGTLAANAAGTALAVANQTFSSTVAGSYLVTASGGAVTNTTVGGSPALQGGIGTATIKVWRLAAPSAIGSPLTFSGNHHVGDLVAAQNLSLTNTATADGFSEKLDAGIVDSTGGAVGTDSVSLLAAGGNSTALQVGLDTSEVGALSGSVTVSLTSNGTGTSGLGTFALAPQVITVHAGNVFRFAAANTIGAVTFSGNHHVGDVVTPQALSLTNTAAADDFSEKLDAAFTGTTGGATGTGAVSLLLPGDTDADSLLVGLNTSTVGAKSGTVTVGLTSNGAGTSSLGTTALTSQVITVNAGSVFRFAAPGVIGSSVTLANVHVGDTFGTSALSITNSAANDGFSEGLNAATANLTGDASAAGTITNLLGTNTAISVSLSSTATAGAKTGTVDVLLTSNGANSDLANTALAPQTVTVNGSVFRLAAAGTIGSPVVFSGNHHLGDAVTGQALTISNEAAADGFSEGLDAAFLGSTGSALGAGTFSLLAPGGSNATSLLVSLDTASVGAKSGTVTVGLTSNGAGTSLLGTTALGSQVITVNAGSVFRLAAANTIGAVTFSGNHHVGDVVAPQALSLTNTAAADGFSEKLDAAYTGATGGATTTDSISLLSPGDTNSTSLLVGLNTATVGAKAGTVTVALTSNGAGTSLLGTTALASQVVTVHAGSIFRLAAPGVIGSSVTLANVHVGDTFGTAALSITNSAANDGFSEGLNAATANLTGDASAAGAITNLPGTSNAISVGLGNASTGTAGARTGTVDITLVSNGTASGLANTALATQPVTVSGAVFNLAAANVITPSVSLGRVRAGGTFGTAALSVTNTAAVGAFTEGLNATLTASSGAATHNSGAISDLGGGASNSASLAVGLGGAANTATPGAVSGTVKVGLASNGTASGLANTALTAQIVSVSGFVYSGAGVWNLPGSSTWAAIPNWQANGGVPGLDAGFTATDTATFATAVTGDTVVSLQGVSPSLQAVIFDTATHDYEIDNTGGGTLQLDNGATAATVTNSAGTHRISAPVELRSNVTVAVTGAGDSLAITGTVTQSGTRSLTKTGAGTLTLNGDQLYNTLVTSGGTTNINGVLGTGTGTASVQANATTRFGSVSQSLASLTIGAGATVVFTSGATGFSSGEKGSSGGGSALVPEPSALGLLLVGALGMLTRRRR
jgi:autotransporter-associated beta strand protein